MDVQRSGEAGEQNGDRICRSKDLKRKGRERVNESETKDLEWYQKQRSHKRIITKRKGTETEIKYGRMLKTENIVLEGRKRNEDGKINGDGKRKSYKWKKSENNKVENVQNETDTQTEKENETESMIGCTGGYPH